MHNRRIGIGWTYQRDGAVDEKDIRQIVIRCQRGEREAFATLYRHFRPFVFRTAYLIVRSAEDADEITQLVFLELLSALRRYDADRRFRPWLSRVVYNLTADYQKRNHRERMAIDAADPQTILSLTPDPGPSPDAAFERNEIRDTIWNALATLPFDYRAAIVLRYYGELNEAEMATALGIRRGTVKSRLHRALRAVEVQMPELVRLLPGGGRDVVKP